MAQRMRFYGTHIANVDFFCESSKSFKIFTFFEYLIVFRNF